MVSTLEGVKGVPRPLVSLGEIVDIEFQGTEVAGVPVDGEWDRPGWGG